MVYLPTTKNQPNVGRYTVRPMDPITAKWVEV